jgi:tRNA threonylcarbamoyladenosine biosynthesis protein TsaB
VKILAIDTATENCSAALLIDGKVTHRELETERGHADRILAMVDEVLAEAALALGAVDAIAFGRGPGAFTGVRLAASVTQGLAFGAGVGVVPVSDLRAVAQRALDAAYPLSAPVAHSAQGGYGAHSAPGSAHSATRVLVCNDARMNEVYWGWFEQDPDGLALPVGEERVGKPESVSPPVGSGPHPALGAGRGFAVYPILRTYFAQSLTSIQDSLLPRAAEIARLALPDVLGHRLLPPEEAVPVYLRDNVVHVRSPSGSGA